MKTSFIHRYMNKWCVSLYESSALIEFVETEDFEQVMTLIHAWHSDGRREVIHQLALDLQ